MWMATRLKLSGRVQSALNPRHWIQIQSVPSRSCGEIITRPAKEDSEQSRHCKSPDVDEPATSKVSLSAQSLHPEERRLIRTRSLPAASEVGSTQRQGKRTTCYGRDGAKTVDDDNDVSPDEKLLRRLDTWQDDGKNGTTSLIDQREPRDSEALVENCVGSSHVEVVPSTEDPPAIHASPGKSYPIARWLGSLRSPDFEYEPMESSKAEELGYPKLDFKPLVMRAWFLAVTTVFFSACLAALGAMLARAHSGKGIIHASTWIEHIAYRYVPVALGSISSGWWRAVATTYGSLHPYLIMSARKPNTTEEKGCSAAIQRPFQAHFPLGIFQPGFFGLVALLLTGRWLIVACMLLDFVNGVYLMPLNASFVQITPHGASWDVVISSKIGYALMSMYATLSVVTLALLVTLKDKPTGLKWEPISIADQLALIQGSNIGLLFDNLEVAESKDYVRLLKARGPTFGGLRLGYWKHRRDGSIWHGMAFVPKTLTTRQNISKGRKQEQERKRSHRNPRNVEAAAAEQFTSNQASRDIALARYRNVLGIVCEPFLAVYALATFSALGVMAVALSKGYLNHGIPLRVDPLKPAPDLSQFKNINSQTFRTKENFTFIFLPVFLMNCFNLLWFNVDEFYRHMRPFASMDTPGPASSNILLDYPTCAPLLVSLKAAENRHWRVALFSLLSLTGTIPPIIVSGIFVNTGNTSESIVRPQPVNFWATFAILLIYLICVVVARPSTAYRLPRCVWDIADLTLFCYKSRIMSDKILGALIFSAQDQTDTKIHMESRIHLAKKEYVFGMYLGTDGKRHMGFDVSERQTSSGQVVTVTTFEPGKALYLTNWGLRYYFRWPQARDQA